MIGEIIFFNEFIHKFVPSEIPADILKSIFNNHTSNSLKPNDIISAVIAIHIGSVLASRYYCIQDGMGTVYSSLIFDIIGESGVGKSTILKYIRGVFEQCSLDKFIARPGGSGRGVETSLKETPRGSVLIDEQSRTELSGSATGVNWEENALIAVDTIITQQESSINFKALSSAKLSKKARTQEAEETRCKRPAQSFIRCSQPKTWIQNVVVNNKAANGTLGRALVVILPKSNPPTKDEIKNQRFKPQSTLLLTIDDIETIRNIALEHTNGELYELFDDGLDSITVSKSYKNTIPNPTVIKVEENAYEILIDLEYKLSNICTDDSSISVEGCNGNKINEIQRYACNRIVELVYRICVILAACSRRNVVSREMADWAIGFVLTLKLYECKFFESEIVKAQEEIDKLNEEKFIKEAMAKQIAKEQVEQESLKAVKDSILKAVDKFGEEGTTISRILQYSRLFRNSSQHIKNTVIPEMVADKLLFCYQKKLENGQNMTFYSSIESK
jgi:energy-coupling factor transporter ATP-binding protein EcfA2